MIMRKPVRKMGGLNWRAYFPIGNVRVHRPKRKNEIKMFIE